MYRFKEGEPNLSFRLADPNRDNYQDSILRVGKVVIPEKDVQGHVKKIGIRNLPTIGQVLSVANGVNSRSAVVFRCVFDIAKSS
jgi:hypothetical protein